MRSLLLLIITIFSFCFQANSQVNIMGKPGYINTPSAEWDMERPLGFSFGHLPGNYSMFGNEKTVVNFYNVRASLTSFFEVNLSIAHRPARAEKNNLGIGDRQLDFRFRLIKEKKYLPSIVLGWTPPGSSAPYLAHDYLVATKNFESSIGHFQLTAGYGSPYVFLKDPNGDSYLDLRVERKADTRLNTTYLTGFFSALKYSPVEFGGITMEYDSNTLNAGVYLRPFEWLYLQGHTYEGKEWGVTAALNLSLNNLPKSIRKHEKRMD